MDRYQVMLRKLAGRWGEGLTQGKPMAGDHSRSLGSWAEERDREEMGDAHLECVHMVPRWSKQKVWRLTGKEVEEEESDFWAKH